MKTKKGKYAVSLAGAVESRATSPTPSPNGDEGKVVVGKSNKALRERYRQTSVWVEGTVHDEIKVALIREKKDFSTLVGELLTEWLSKRKERA